MTLRSLGMKKVKRIWAKTATADTADISAPTVFTIFDIAFIFARAADESLDDEDTYQSAIRDVGSILKRATVTPYGNFDL